MKFPLYNECPNCGGLTSDHSKDFRWNCNCSRDKNAPIWDQIYPLQNQLKDACPHDKERLTQEIADLYKKLAPDCQCNLMQQEVANAIAIQAAVEIALQRAGK